MIQLLFLLIAVVAAASTRRALTAYAPVTVTCPTTPLVRPAGGISSLEQQYYAARYAKASDGLRTWLKHTGNTFEPARYPSVGLTTSGGGYRSLLLGAGVIQGLDKRDGNTTISGLFQGLTYQAGLSGGSWLLSSFAGNNYPTITSLKTSLWESAFQNGLFVPDGPLLTAAADSSITADILSKEAAGFPPTLTDPWGRLLSYQLLKGSDGGVADTLSGIASVSNFTAHNVPFPIITSLGVKTFEGECLPGPNATQYEFSPFEFGSWDQGVSAFTPTAYLGSALSNGAPMHGTCTANYDNLGHVLGTSSNLFNEACASSSTLGNSTQNPLVAALEAFVNTAHATTTRDEYAAYPNPFYQYSRSSLIAAQPELDLVDGGEALQNNPIWPFLHRSNIDVLLVNDNSADTSNNFPNGSEILTTYVQAQAAGLTRMPPIPSVDTFIAEGLNQRPTFFGCNCDSQLTIVYIPNYNYTFMSNEPTSKIEYSPAETDGMIANGVQMANKGGDQRWPTCLACGIMKKAGGKLPSVCAGCFEQYCYN